MMRQPDKHISTRDESYPSDGEDNTSQEQPSKYSKKYDAYLADKDKEKYEQSSDYRDESPFSPEELEQVQNEYTRSKTEPSYKTPRTRQREERVQELILLEILKSYEESGFVSEKLSSSIDNIIDSIRSQTDIEGIPLHEKILDPNFRFVSSKNPAQSRDLSEAFALVVKLSRDNGFVDGFSQGARKGTEAAVSKRVSDADEFAKNIFSVVEKVKHDSGVSTIRGTVDKLNQKGIQSPNGGKWNKSSMQLLQKRWKELGLVSPKLNP